MKDAKGVREETSTIAALATAAAPAGIAVVRVSGPLSKKALRAIFRAKKDPADEPRHLIYGDLIDFKSGAVIDHALAAYMPNPFSFTGEDVVEFQFHGSPLIVQRVLRSLFSFGIIPAEPGEFTKRAFLNGKMDLVQSEAIADLISATSEQALKIASEQLAGKFSHSIDQIGEPLRDTLAEVEAGLDFPEEDIEPEKLTHLVTSLEGARQKIAELIESYNYGAIVKDGFRVLLCGRPNVGKSSILNLILGKERAIVTEVSGTTRDLIEAEATFGGYTFHFCDSAGIRETTDMVEQIGVELAKEKVGWADLVIVVADATDSSGEYKTVLDQVRGKAQKIWMVTNKIDLNPAAIGSFFCDSQTCSQNFYISVKSKSGISNLTQALVDEVSSRVSLQPDGGVILTNERQRSCLVQADSALNQALIQISNSAPAEIIAEDIRQALKALEELVGKTYTEDILGRIFSKFCIGK